MVAQRLVTAGHSLVAIGGYTLAQIELFTAALEREDKARMREGLIIARAARGKPDKFRQILRELGG